MEKSGHKWKRVNTNGNEWKQMNSNELKWKRVNTNGNEWNSFECIFTLGSIWFHSGAFGCIFSFVALSPVWVHSGALGLIWVHFLIWVHSMSLLELPFRFANIHCHYFVFRAHCFTVPFI